MIAPGKNTTKTSNLSKIKIRGTQKLTAAKGVSSTTVHRAIVGQWVPAEILGPQLRQPRDRKQLSGLYLEGISAADWARRKRVIPEKTLEIYGDMSIKLYHNGSVKEEVKWHQGGDPAINWSISDGFYEINENNFEEVEIEDVNLDGNDYVKLYANFYESDGAGTPDHFGDATLEIPLNDITATIVRN